MFPAGVNSILRLLIYIIPEYSYRRHGSVLGKLYSTHKVCENDKFRDNYLVDFAVSQIAWRLPVKYFIIPTRAAVLIRQK